MNPSEWLSTSQAAQRLDLTTARVRQLLTADKLGHVRTALGRLVDPATVDRLAAERRKQVATPAGQGR